MSANLFLLRELLLKLFQSEELRMFVHLRVDASLVHCLPAEGVSAEILAYRACVAFEQRGHIGPELFALLKAERPLREDDIQAVESAFQNGISRPREVSERHIQNLEKTLESLDRCLEKIESGDSSERMWRALALLMMGVTAYLIWKHYFNDQSSEEVASDPEAQERLIAEAQLTSAHGHAYLDVTVHLQKQVSSLPEADLPAHVPSTRT